MIQQLEGGRNHFVMPSHRAVTERETMIWIQWEAQMKDFKHRRNDDACVDNETSCLPLRLPGNPFIFPVLPSLD